MDGVFPAIGSMFANTILPIILLARVNRDRVSPHQPILERKLPLGKAQPQQVYWGRERAKRKEERTM